MQAVSNGYKSASIAGVRQLGWMVMVATDKRFQFGIDLWTWDVSIWNGGDLWAGEDNVLTQWDRYRYYDYSNRMLSMEWERQLSVPYSSARAFGSFDLQNTDGFLNYTSTAKVESLSEDFSLPLDPAVWEDWSNGQAVITDDQMEITSRATADYFGINTVYKYDLTGSYIHTELVDAGDQSLASFEVYPVSLEVDLDNIIQIFIRQNVINIFKNDSGVETTIATLDYYPEIHRWFRIREASGVTYWEYSPDGEIWVSMHSEANPINVTALEPNIFVGTSSDEGVESTAIFANVNYGPGSSVMTNRGSTATIYDQFGSLDDNVWLDWSGGQVTANGELVINNPSNDTGYNGINTISPENLTGTYAAVELKDAGNQSITSWEVYPIHLSLDANNELYIVVTNGDIISQKIVATVATQVNSTPYDPDIHKWFRIRESSGTTYWEYSTDGDTWSTLHSESNPFAVTALQANLFVGTWQNEASAESATFDSFMWGVVEDAGSIQAGVSPIGSYMLPGRPFRLFAGFGNDVHQGIVGVTTDAPEYDEREKIVSFHGHDFFGKISDLTLDVGLTIESQTTGEVLTTILTNIVGLEAGQFVLDTSFNEIAFGFWAAGTELGDIFDELMEAEIGRLFMDEMGVIRFYNRERLVGDPVITLDKTNIVNLEQQRQTKIFNSIEVVSNPRVVEGFQTVFDLAIADELPAGNSEFFFSTYVGENRVPVVEIAAITVYTANTASDGSGTNITPQVSIQSAELLGDTVKVTIANSSGSAGYLTSLEISGRPAIQQPEIRAVAKNQDSIDRFEERKLPTIENNLIQSQSDASNLAYLLLSYTQGYNNTLRVKAKAIPALQAGDGISVAYGSINGLGAIENVTLRLDKDGFTQYLDIRRSPFEALSLWEWDVSEWNGGDVWGF